jgi:hypothetical protein
MNAAAPFDLYVWKARRNLDLSQAAAIVASWEAAGGDPAASPFEPDTDIGWFHRELMADHPGLEVVSDAVPNTSTRPIWLSTEAAPAARLVAIRLPQSAAEGVLESVFGLATKYDLVVFDRQGQHIHVPLQEMADHASATFWPRGAIQAAVAGSAGGGIAVLGWFLGIPIVSWVLVAAGGFMAVMAVFTFIHEGRRTLRARRRGQ